VTNLFTPSNSGLETVPTSKVFSTQDISIIEEWQPKDRISFTSVWSKGPWHINLALNRYGEYTVTDGAKQTYGAKTLTDINVSYHFDSGMTLNFSGNNIFDVTPDRNLIGNTRNGSIEAAPGGPLVVSSTGIFDYSRRSAPFGFNGGYYSVGLSWDF